ncbi:hypothetical protein GCM10022631_10700 [Deinococcus rubellus]|uniref:helix-turn-helix transcriptional regulator n=1 Tax=Deinococcus rubellus TaxID=1889240 RepID=UPI0031EDD495
MYAMAANEIPSWSLALKARRDDLSKKEGDRVTQEDVAARTGDLVSQRTVSHLEQGTLELGSLAFSRVVALAKALRWTLPDMQRATGLDLDIAEPEGEAVSEEIYMPEGLFEAIRRYGDDYPALKKPRVQEQLRQARSFDGGPQTASDWLRFYLDNERWIKG